jgi:protein gp37
MSYHRRRIFSLSLGDWLDDEVDIEWLAEMLDTIRQCPDVTWILCTKRPEDFFDRMDEVMELEEEVTQEQLDSGKHTNSHNWILEWTRNENVPANIILLTSVENQATADKRIPELLKIPAACRGLSLEPLLGHVDLSGHIFSSSAINWLIIGGESGASARPCNVEWIRSLVKDGLDADCAVFVKQFGARPLLKPCRQHHFDWKYKTSNAKRPEEKMFAEDFYENQTMWRILFTDKKGGDPAEWMEHYRIQEWPKGF